MFFKSLFIKNVKVGLMNCPKCKKSNISVIDSRDVDDKVIRRRRKCDTCQYRFTTYERIEPIKLSVTKRSGLVEPFEREKIIKGIAIASGGRIPGDKIEGIADEIEIKLTESKNSNTTSKKIGNMVIGRLKKIDEISYLRFASVYKNFENLGSFEQELIKLKK